VKEELRDKIAPPLQWFGTERIQKNLFDIEVHIKFGPSLFEVMEKYKDKIAETTLYLLAYHLVTPAIHAAQTHRPIRYGWAGHAFAEPKEHRAQRQFPEKRSVPY
jgi:hypothetical protein